MACMWNYEGWQIPAHCLEGVLREARWPLMSRGRSAWRPPPALQPPSDPILPTRCLAAATTVAWLLPPPLPWIRMVPCLMHQAFRQNEACLWKGGLQQHYQPAVSQALCIRRANSRQAAVRQAGPAWAWQGVLWTGRVNYPERFHLTSPAICRPCPGLRSHAGLGQAPSACAGASCLTTLSSDMSSAASWGG